MQKQEGTMTLQSMPGVTKVDNQPLTAENKYEEIFELAKTRHTPLCPVRDIIARLSDKWSMLAILCLGSYGTLRFNQIRHKIGDISQRMLTVTLRNLENDGLITRQIFAEVPPRVEYNLTKLGASLLNQYTNFTAWAECNSDEIMASRKAHPKSLN